MFRFGFLSALALAISSTQVAHAQDTDAAQASSGITPPKLVSAVQPIYPASKLASRESATVGLVLMLDATGQVQDVTVSASAGEEFDAAAVAAARELRFEPALRDGSPVAAKIPFRVQFEPAPVAIAPPSSVPAAATPANAPSNVTPPAAAPADAEAVEIEVVGERPPREPTQRVLAAEEIQRIPGTNGDALRSIGNMPGVARVGSFDGLLIVRGSSPRDTQVFIDGTSVPLVYHFGGLSSVVPSEILERIEFYPGNFGPQYGRSTGGIVEVGVKSPRKDRIGGLLQIDTVDARLLVEGPIGKSTRFMLGGRRSWLDAWLGPALREAGVGVTVAPVYYDYQAMIEHDLTRNTTLRLFAFGADDRVELTLNAADPNDPAIGGRAASHEGFWRVQARLDTRATESVRWTTTLSVGNNVNDSQIGEMFLDLAFLRLEARSDLRMRLASFATAIAGVDVYHDRFDVAYRFPAEDFEGDTNTGPAFGKPMIRVQGDGHLTRPAGYAMLELRPLPALKLLPGVRADYDQGTKRWTTDPRVGVRYDLHPQFPRTTLKGGIGLFHQPPEPYESIEPFGNAGLKSESAMHYSLGLEQEVTRPLEVSIEGFYKDLRDIVVSTPAASTTQNGRRYVNDGSGRTYGSELLLRYKPLDRLFGWVAYTLSRSERRDSDQDELYRYDFDQTHIITALASYKLGRGWQVGARFRYVTGSPYTPELGGTVDYDAGTYAPVTSRARNSARLPAFHQLDVRVDKTWKLKGGSFTAYLDLQNAYNHQNTEGIGYNFDYSQKTETHGLPILPVIGIRGEL